MLDIINEVAVLDKSLMTDPVLFTGNYVMTGIPAGDTHKAENVTLSKFWNHILTDATVIAKWAATSPSLDDYIARADYVVVNEHRAGIKVDGGLVKVRDKLFATDVTIGGVLLLEKGWLNINLNEQVTTAMMKDNQHTSTSLKGRYVLDPTKIRRA
jgi:hypothetical protein